MLTVLTLPGYTNAGPDHWLTHWERLHRGVRRIEQEDWDYPVRTAWISRIDEVVSGMNGTVVLAAHSLGCIALAHWVVAGGDPARVAGALLVAPADVERDDTPSELSSFAPIPRVPLPFPTVVVASRNDPWAEFSRSAAFAHAWGSRLVDAGAVGHLDSASGLGEWPAGWAQLREFGSTVPCTSPVPAADTPAVDRT